jgi:hypothetical protein
MLLRAALACLAAAAACRAALPADFIRGASTRADPREAALLKQMGASHARVYALWAYGSCAIFAGASLVAHPRARAAQPTISALEPNLTVAALRADPQLVYVWAATLDWAQNDERVQQVLDVGLTPIVEVFEGTVKGLPKYKDEPVDPVLVGETPFLAYAYRYARAAVNRYKAHVSFYQIENELNEAWLAGLAGQRVRDLAGGPWRNWTFVTDLLRTLQTAVKDEQPAATTTTNLHTDVPQEVHQLLGLPGFYLEAAADWAGPAQQLVDVLSFDAYPNVLIPSPSLGSVVGQRVAALRGVVASDMRVFVMETGYSVGNDTTNVPAIFNYSEAAQAQFASDAVTAVAANGGAGLLFFTLAPDSGQMQPPGGYTQQDVEAFTAIESFIETLNITAAVRWGLAHVPYLSTRGVFIASQISRGWGLLRDDFSPRAAFFELQRLFADTA